MATSAFTLWYDEVLPEIPGVLQTMALNHIRRAAIEFCERSQAWVVDQAAISVVAEQSSYAWTPPTNTEVVKPRAVWLEKIELPAKTPGECSAIYGDYMQATGSPKCFTQDEPATFILVPQPTAAITDGITAKLAIKPTPSATGIDTIIFNRYYDGIAAGAKWRLLKMPKKPWTDKEAAAEYKATFDAAIAKALLETSKSFAGARGRVRAQYL